MPLSLPSRRTPVRWLTVLLLASSALAGCSSKFEWRTIANDDGRFSIMYPAKPTLDERMLPPIEGHTLKMQMQAARAGGATFAVGSVQLPNDDPELQHAVLNLLENGLARNIGINMKLQSIQIPLTEEGKFVDGEALSGNGKVAGHPDHRTVSARFAIRGRRVVQAVVIADKPVPPEEIQQFLDSLKLY
jgi:hypothetical protein